MATITVLYGFGEGPRVAGRFHKALKAKGHTIITDPAEADVIITHSGGCLLVPAETRATQIIHIAPYHWPRKSWFACMGRKLLDDMRTHHREGEVRFWARKTLWNFTYSLNMIANIRMAKNVKGHARWLHGDKAVVVRPKLDSFCTPDPKAFTFEKDPSFLSFPGYHDDCWRNPEPYLRLIK